MKNTLIKALLVIGVIVPASVLLATMLWNGVLTQVVSWAYPINFLQMFGLMVLIYMIHPGQKASFKSKNND
tara:strand:+ start:247 stop:459 length:213 start_codon:yes stop_codon:yes gene_type:complete